MARERVQTTLRIPIDVLERLRKILAERGEDMNSLVQRLIEDWLRNPTLPELEAPLADDPEVYHLRAYMRCLPAVALVKEQHGRIIFANPEFQRLVLSSDIAGHDANDFFSGDTAAVIIRNDRVVFGTNKEQWFAEPVCVRSELRTRLCNRFPIRDGQGGVKWTGALGFDWKQIQEQAQNLSPGDVAKRVSCWETDPLVFWPAAVTSPSSLLKEYLGALPAIAVVKDLEGRLLWVNERYSRVTKLKGDDVLGHLPGDHWPRSVAEPIMIHDRLVREARKSFVSVESMPANQGGERLNVRFPIFNSAGELELTGTIGLDYRGIRTAIEELSLTCAHQ